MAKSVHQRIIEEQIHELHQQRADCIERIAKLARTEHRIDGQIFLLEGILSSAKEKPSASEDS